MIILFQNISFLKEFLDCNGCFGLFSKMKKASGASFWCTFSVWSFYKKYLILYQLTKFQCHTLFLSQDVKQNVLLSFYLDRWWRHKLFKFFLRSTCKAMADREKKRGKENTQNWISRERKELFRWNKKHFS